MFPIVMQIGKKAAISLAASAVAAGAGYLFRDKIGKGLSKIGRGMQKKAAGKKKKNSKKKTK